MDSTHQAIFAANFDTNLEHPLDLWQDCSNGNGVWLIGSIGLSIYKLDIINNVLTILDKSSGHVKTSVDIPSHYVIDQPFIVAAGRKTGRNPGPNPIKKLRCYHSSYRIAIVLYTLMGMSKI